MISATMVRQSCVSHRIHVSRVENEWRLVCNEYVNTRREEPTAYYTDDNDDAYMTAVRMRRDYDEQALLDFNRASHAKLGRLVRS